MMNIIQSYLTNHPCYKEGRTITPQGLMLHSVGCSQPRASAFISYWNSGTFNAACVHAFIDAITGDTYQTLPWNYRAWHGGGSSNNTHIGVEMCEPDCIKYVGGGTFTCSDVPRAKEMVTRTYNSAVELFAYLCKQFNLNPLGDGVIVSHSEGYKRGIASNHGDPEHLWNQLGMGYTMNGFRNDVKKAMGEPAPTPTPTPTTEPSVLYRVQVGAYSVKANAEKQLAKVKAAGFSAFITEADGMYKIQVGAYSVKANADAMVEKVKAAGFSAFVTQVTITQPTEPTEPSAIKAGIECVLSNTPVYSSEGGASIGKRSGTYYTWDNVVKNGRIRMTNSTSRIGVAGQVSFWMDVTNIK